ncbi:MAG: hypothetical protein AMJ95_00435 [Omnitrophica WOR_2 bacterium SM23_72]|nr:MAG: hypothetical protein AMJ95_00435 [Omnitrophica WOR_2 bacterium SM23_72]
MTTLIMEMTPFNQNTPEKQLLDLIEKPKGPKSLDRATLKFQGLRLFSFQALKGRVTYLQHSFKTLFKDGKIYQINIRALNQILKLCVAFLAFYFVINLAIALLSVNKEVDLKADIEKSQKKEVVKASSLLKSLTFYLEKARERDVFHMGRGLPVEIAVAGRGPSARILEATKDFRLVGIAWSEDPDVMIEDTANQRTLFLKRGQTFGNDVKLKAVYKDKVVLGFGQEEIELR